MIIFQNYAIFYSGVDIGQEADLSTHYIIYAKGGRGAARTQHLLWNAFLSRRSVLALPVSHG